MEMRENMPGILFQSVERARKQAIQTELSRRGLGTLGQPMILFLLKDKGREGRIAAQKELSDAMHVSPATVAGGLCGKAGRRDRPAPEGGAAHPQGRGRHPEVRPGV